MEKNQEKIRKNGVKSQKNGVKSQKNGYENRKKLSDQEKNIIKALNCLVPGKYSKFEDNGSGLLIKWAAACKLMEGKATTLIKNSIGLKAIITYDYDTCIEEFKIISR